MGHRWEHTIKGEEIGAITVGVARIEGLVIVKMEPGEGRGPQWMTLDLEAACELQIWLNKAIEQAMAEHTIREAREAADAE